MKTSCRRWPAFEHAKQNSAPVRDRLPPLRVLIRSSKPDSFPTPTRPFLCSITNQPKRPPRAKDPLSFPGSFGAGRADLLSCNRAPHLDRPRAGYRHSPTRRNGLRRSLGRRRDIELPSGAVRTRLLHSQGRRGPTSCRPLPQPRKAAALPPCRRPRHVGSWTRLCLRESRPASTDRRDHGASRRRDASTSVRTAQS